MVMITNATEIYRYRIMSNEATEGVDKLVAGVEGLDGQHYYEIYVPALNMGHVYSPYTYLEQKPIEIAQLGRSRTIYLYYVNGQIFGMIGRSIKSNDIRTAGLRERVMMSERRFDKLRNIFSMRRIIPIFSDYKVINRVRFSGEYQYTERGILLNNSCGSLFIPSLKDIVEQTQIRELETGVSSIQQGRKIYYVRCEYNPFMKSYSPFFIGKITKSPFRLIKLGGQ